MKRYLPILLIIACAAALVLGLGQLFKLRFDVGDVYPPYSSLRSDPLGTMAFYESLEKLSEFTVRRDYSTANELPAGRQTAYLHLAASRYEWNWLPENLYREIEQFVTAGGRLVITLSPESATGYRSPFDRKFPHDEPETNSVPPAVKDENNQKAKDANRKKKTRSPYEEEARAEHLISINDHWGVDFKVLDLIAGDEFRYEPVRVENRSDLPLPESLDWHSGIVITSSNTAWQTIYARGTNAVVVERAFGRGQVVIATDTYFLSNEAMLQDRHAGLLAWLIGGGRNVVFDEAHLGVTEQPGIATLMRKYRLHWLTAGLLLLAGLFIWKNSTSLAPVHPEEQRQDYVAGRDAASGFVNLLRRSIAPRDLLGTCFAEWKRSAKPTGKYSSTRLQEAELAFLTENALPPKERNPLRAYQQIHMILETRKPETKP